MLGYIHIWQMQSAIFSLISLIMEANINNVLCESGFFWEINVELPYPAPCF